MNIVCRPKDTDSNTQTCLVSLGNAKNLILIATPGAKLFCPKCGAKLSGLDGGNFGINFIYRVESNLN